MKSDPSDPDVDGSLFTHEYWTTTAYGDYKDELYLYAPEPRGICFTMITL